ncbi:MAG: YARHG domain-containing protein [Lachnospiraceae bacterium]|nr:YARHG domain-containing protein [Lachnospiraceae bacterium]
MPEISGQTAKYELIKYDSGKKAYKVGLGDFGASGPELFGFIDNGDSTFTVYSGIVDYEAEDPENRVLSYSKIRLTGNPYAKNHDEPVYYYSVKTAEIIKKAEFENVEGELQKFDASSSADSGKKTDEPAEKEEEESGASGDYILPWSDSVYLEQSDIRGLSDEELRLARNEIYARHGRKFKDIKLQEYFGEKRWYTPEKDEVPDTELNKYEIANRDLIVKEEKDR